MQKLFWTAITSAVAVSMAGGASVRTEAKGALEREIEAELFTPYKPPRAGDGVGTIITFDREGREIVVARPGTCFPDLRDPIEQATAILKTSTQRVTNVGLTANLAEAYKMIVDLSFTARADSDVKADMKFDKPYIQASETLVLKSKIRALATGSDCYRAAYDPKNIIIYSVLGANGAEFTFTDKSNKQVKLTANLLINAKVEPAVQRKFDGQSSLVIDQKMLIAYRALEARNLPGGIQDTVVIEELKPERIEKYRADSGK